MYENILSRVKNIIRYPLAILDAIDTIYDWSPINLDYR